MKFDIITIGGATEDIILHTKESVLIDNKADILKQKLLAFEYGAKIKIEESNAYFGGGAANVAVAASLLGLKTAALVAIGDDSRGAGVLKNFKKKGVDVSLVKILKNKATGFSVLVLGADYEHIAFTAREANSELVIAKADIAKLKNTDWLYVSSLSGRWEAVLGAVFKNLTGKVKIAWNPGRVQLQSGVKTLGKYLKNTPVLIMNKDEAIELVASDKKFQDAEIEFLNDINNLLPIIRGFGPIIVVVTDGGNGAHAFDGENYYYQPIIKRVKEVDSTGVGDSFGASFIVGLEIYKNDIKKALALGAKNSAANIQQEGAQNGLLTKKDIKK